MEWVETTGRTVEEAKELALDQLGVVADEAEFEILTTPKPGLFGRLRGEARVRARVRPTPARPKQDRRRGRRPGGTAETDGAVASDEPERQASDRAASDRRSGRGKRSTGSSPSPAAAEAVAVLDDPATPAPSPVSPGGTAMTTDDRPSEPVAEATSAADVEAVRRAAVEFVGRLTAAFGFDATVDAVVEGNEIEVRVDGSSLGLLIGPGGRTLLGIQDLARVAAQRRLGDHDTRLRVDVAGYREKRREALERFASTVAEQVRTTGVARSLDPMPSADRKVLHDALAAIDGVSSRSEGEDPNRRVVVVPT
jgi:spoIIIJ-associated protein